MTPLEEQFHLLLTAFPGSRLENLSNGAAAITVPDVSLPPGWSKSKTHVYFVAPAGYPFAKPDCFWADGDLRLASGATPQATGNNAFPVPAPTPLLWFSWHLAQWDPNRDTLLTYLYGIRGRFRDLR